MAAYADTNVFEDAIGDSSSVDISQVRVAHRDNVIVRVQSAVPLNAGQVYAFWIDTGGDPQPDYYVSFQANTDFGEVLTPVRSFGKRPSRTVPCRGIRLRADIFTGKPVSMRIPRRCLDDPRRVRVAVQFRDESTDTVDWAADRRTFGPWVKR